VGRGGWEEGTGSAQSARTGRRSSAERHLTSPPPRINYTSCQALPASACLSRDGIRRVQCRAHRIVYAPPALFAPRANARATLPMPQQPVTSLLRFHSIHTTASTSCSLCHFATVLRWKETDWAVVAEETSERLFCGTEQVQEGNRGMDVAFLHGDLAAPICLVYDCAVSTPSFLFSGVILSSGRRILVVVL